MKQAHSEIRLPIRGWRCLSHLHAGVCLLFLSLMVSVQGQIVISEIMYNPASALEPGTTNVIDGDNFEFVELLNTGVSSVELQGMSFTQGISYTFTDSISLAPGERYVIPEDVSRFEMRYGSLPNVSSLPYGGKLSNGGERLSLAASNGVSMFSVRYRDDEDWPQRADGMGPSLVLVDELGDPDLPASWASHDRLYGQPGSTDAVYQIGVVINEILAHTDPPLEDAVEIYNTTGSSVPITGWYLSDDQREPRKYRITNTTVAATGFRVFYEYQFNTNGLFNTNNVPFGLSELGDDVYLTAPGVDTNDLRLIDAHEFDATDNGVSLGRYPDGASGFSILSAHSFGVSAPVNVAHFRTGSGAANSVPATRAVVINEIMYHPVQTNELAYEYIELRNNTSSNISIAGWTFGGVQFTNPPGTIIPANGYLVVAADATTLTAHHGLTNVVGDWVGQLSNGGENIQLFNQDLVLVDEVDYRDGRPWSTGADGTGPSLERVQASGPSDTPINWRSSRASTNWTQIVWTQLVSAGTADLRMWLDFEGKCWVDDISVKKNGLGAEVITNNSFEAGMSGWTAKTNHAQSRVESGIARTGTNALVLVGNFSRYLTGFEVDPINLFYGSAETSHVASSTFPVTAGFYVISAWVKRQHPGGFFFMGLDGGSNSLFIGHEGTPGVENTMDAVSEPIGITSVDKDFSIVEVGATNVIRADVSSEAGVSSVTLHYRPVSSNDYQYTDAHYASMPMGDDGIGPDLTAGDGEYAAQLAFATNRYVIRYHVTAVASNGMQTRSPQIDDQSDDFGYWVESSPVQSNIPNWHIFFDGEELLYPNTLRALAVSPEGQVFTDIRVRHRGSPFSSSLQRAGIALRVQRDRRYDAWFADNQDGINFRHSLFRYRRVVNEALAYHLQDKIGLVAPHYRHACIWLNGWPTITGELEAPNEGFLDLHDMEPEDYISRAGYSGRRIVDGEEALDNFTVIYGKLQSLSNAERINYIRTNLWYESIRYSVAFQNMIGNGDQYFRWNMFQHRQATNGLWAQYPWDIDQAFNVETNGVPGTFLAELHPYYETPDHPSIWDGASSRPLGESLFYPENHSTTEPYRHRQQMTMWRWYHTVFTTNHLNPFLDALQTNLVPAYQAISNITGVTESRLLAKVVEVKNFISLRRDFLMNGGWSDQNTNIWNTSNVYDPSTVVINEIMVSPNEGGEYIELANTSTQTVDLTAWTLQSGNESYRIPFGTMLGPTSFVVLADTQLELTNTYSALSQSTAVVHRFKTLPLWDHPITFESASEYQTRITEIPQITFPGTGAVVMLSNLQGDVVDTVTYASDGVWPLADGASLELFDPTLENSTAQVWRSSFVMGTPGFANSATNDVDGDQMLDAFEQLVILAFPGVNTLEDVDPDSDQDLDGYGVAEEFLFGLNPTVADGGGLGIDILSAGLPTQTVNFLTVPLFGSAYDLYTNRLYTLQRTANLLQAGGWEDVPNYIDLIGTGQTVIYTNPLPAAHENFRYQVELEPIH